MSDLRLRISVKGLFFNDNNEVLLVEVKSKPDGEYFCAPGGGLKEGETLQQAVERELIEETGYIGKADDIVFVQDLKFPFGDLNRQLEIFFSGKITGKSQGVEADHKFKFVSKEEFRQKKFLPSELDPFDLKNSVPFFSHLN